MISSRKTVRGALGAAMLMLTASVFADDQQAADVERVRATTHALIKSLMDRGVLTPEAAAPLLRELSATPPAVPTDKESTDQETAPKVRVPYIPDPVKADIINNVRRDVLAQARQERWGDPGVTPEWTRRLKWEGDVRLRYEFAQLDRNNGLLDNYLAINAAGGVSKTATPSLNSREDRQRLRLRARLGLLAAVTDGLSVAMRLSTGSTTIPVSTNSTLGTTNNRPAVLFDQAYAKAELSPELLLVGGRIPNPWFSSDLVWADDLSFDGVAMQWKPRWSARGESFFTLGVFPLQEIELSSQDKWLYGAQGGVGWGTETWRMKFGVAYYDYRNVAGKSNISTERMFDYTAPQFVQKGNTMFDISPGDPTREIYALAADFRELELTGLIDIAYFSPTHITLAAAYVKNIGFDQDKILARTGVTVDEQTNGYLLKLGVGAPKVSEHGEWNVFFGYKHLEADAVLDAFTDSDFHLGGTNAKGWIAGGIYGLKSNATLGLRILSANEITGSPQAMDVVQLDFSLRF